MSGLVLWVLHTTGVCKLELCTCVCGIMCLSTEAETVVLEVCTDIKTKGRDDEEHLVTQGRNRTRRAFECS